MPRCPDTLYIISNPAWPGEYKVGITMNVRKRLSSYNTSDPNRGYRLEHHVAAGDYARRIEHEIHRQFPSRREWVQADIDDLIDAINSRAVALLTSCLVPGCLQPRLGAGLCRTHYIENHVPWWRTDLSVMLILAGWVLGLACWIMIGTGWGSVAMLVIGLAASIAARYFLVEKYVQTALQQPGRAANRTEWGWVAELLLGTSAFLMAGAVFVAALLLRMGLRAR